MRFVIVGTSGAGKSTFARTLAKARDCPHIELDALYWGPDWTAVPHAQFESAVQAAAAGESWVADGNYGAVREVLWSRATHIVWLNFDRSTVFSRVFWRTLGRGLRGTLLWNGNRESLRTAFFSRESILLWSYSTFRKNRLRFAELRESGQFPHLVWTEITNPCDTQRILESLARNGA